MTLWPGQNTRCRPSVALLTAHIFGAPPPPDVSAGSRRALKKKRPNFDPWGRLGRKGVQPRIRKYQVLPQPMDAMPRVDGVEKANSMGQSQKKSAHACVYRSPSATRRPLGTRPAPLRVPARWDLTAITSVLSRPFLLLGMSLHATLRPGRPGPIAAKSSCPDRRRAAPRNRLRLRDDWLRACLAAANRHFVGSRGDFLEGRAISSKSCHGRPDAPGRGTTFLLTGRARSVSRNPKRTRTKKKKKIPHAEKGDDPQEEEPRVGGHVKG
jgi:hypothetical protein